VSEASSVIPRSPLSSPSFPLSHRLRHPRVAALEGALGRAHRGPRGDPRRGALLQDARRAGRAVGHRGRRLRPLPDHVDRLHRDRALPDHGGAAASRTCARPSTSSPTTRGCRRSSSPSASAVCWRRLPASALPSRSPASCSWPGLLAAARRRGRAPGQHRPGRLRRHRHPDHHRRLADQDPLHRDRRLRRPPDPVIALFVPLLLVLMVDGRRGVRQTWPVAVVVGVAFAIAQWISGHLHLGRAHRHHRLARRPGGRRCLPALLEAGRQGGRGPRVPRRERERDLPSSAVPAPRRPVAGRQRPRSMPCPRPSWRPAPGRSPPGRITMALFPYLLVIAIFSIAKLVGPVKTWLATTDLKIPGRAWTATCSPDRAPRTRRRSTRSRGSPPRAPACSSARSSPPSSMACRWRLGQGSQRHGIQDALCLPHRRLGARPGLRHEPVRSDHHRRHLDRRHRRGLSPSSRPILGWIGTAVTGSDTSANALFATLQQTAAKGAGLDPTLLVAANTSGGVVGKMISPQNLTIAATAVGLVGRESDIFRKVILWSVGLIIVMCLLVGLQSTAVLSPGCCPIRNDRTRATRRRRTGLGRPLRRLLQRHDVARHPDRHGQGARAARVPGGVPAQADLLRSDLHQHRVCRRGDPAGAWLRRDLRGIRLRSWRRRGRASGRSATSTTTWPNGGDSGLTRQVDALVPRSTTCPSSSSTCSGSPMSGPTSRTG
jgi:hypothetical protein